VGVDGEGFRGELVLEDGPDRFVVVHDDLR
jgi:hypothetical protein